MATAKKRAPRSAAQIHNARVTKNVIDKAEQDAEDLEITDVSRWKAQSGKSARKLKLPSGFVCLVRNPGMMFFLTQGMIPNSLIDFITKVMSGTEEETEITAGVQDLLKEGKLGDMIELARTVCVHALVKPECLPAPEDEEQRDKDKLYADELDEDDMMFIFNWVAGGTHDLERFQGEQATALQDIRNG